MTRLVSKKRGVSVVISTLLVLAITVVGALSISNLMSTSALTTVNQTPKAIIAANSVLLTAYDTRDGASLFNIPTFDNFSGDDVLCAATCSPPDNAPSAGGTDFIVIQLWNKNTNPIHIKSLQVNGYLHIWDTTTRGKTLNVGGTPASGDFPKAGMFSIVPISGMVQQSNQLVEGDQEILLVIKLSSAIPSDLVLGKPLQILVNIGDEQPAKYVILTGDTK